jgi:hypothetical protein
VLVFCPRVRWGAQAAAGLSEIFDQIYCCCLPIRNYIFGLKDQVCLKWILAIFPSLSSPSAGWINFIIGPKKLS